MRIPPVRAAVAAGAASAAALAAIGVATSLASAASNGVVINEVYGGGGNSGATYTNDFAELANRGGGAASVAGWSVQYQPAGGTSAWQVTPLTGSVGGNGGIYLVQEAAGAGGTTALPTPQATGSINMSATTGTVALVDNSTALTCHTPADCTADADVIDLVGYGTAAVHEGGADAPAPGNATSDQRTSSPDSDQNGTDFITGTPTPDAANTGSSGGGGGTGGTPGPLRIHDIQGTSWVSPYDGQAVTNVPGIVTGVRTAGSSKGYWIQDPDPDGNPATSEGVFVYTGSAPTVAAGDSVLVSGKVQDYYPLASGETTSTTSNLSVTEIDQSSVSVVSTGNTLPAPIVIDPDTVPDTYAPDLGGGNIEPTQITPSRSALDYYEPIEGMRVEVDNARVIGPSDSYAEEYVTTKPTQDESFRGGALLESENAMPSGRLEIVAADGTNPEVNVGDVFSGATIGPLYYSQYGGTSSPRPRSAPCSTAAPRRPWRTGRARSSCRRHLQRGEPRPVGPGQQVLGAGQRDRDQPRFAGHHRGRGSPGQRRCDR